MSIISPLANLDPATGLPKKKTPYDPTANRGAYDNTVGSYFGSNPSSTTVPTSSAPSSFPGSTSIPGFTPDYASLIANDPILGQTKADLAAQGVSDVASRDAAIQRALVQFGTVPDLASAGQALGFDLGPIVNDQTRALAGQNQFSTQATLKDALTKQISQIRRSLAARGALRSGELGYQLGEANKAYGQAQNDATQKLLDTVGGYQSQYAAGVKAAQEALRNAQQDAASRQAQLNPATGSSTAQFAGTAADGSPLYGDGNGNFYDINGVRTDKRPGAAQAAGGQSYSESPSPFPGVSDSEWQHIQSTGSYGQLNGLISR